VHIFLQRYQGNGLYLLCLALEAIKITCTFYSRIFNDREDPWGPQDLSPPRSYFILVLTFCFLRCSRLHPLPLLRTLLTPFLHHPRAYQHHPLPPRYLPFPLPSPIQSFCTEVFLLTQIFHFSSNFKSYYALYTLNYWRTIFR